MHSRILVEAIFLVATASSCRNADQAQVARPADETVDEAPVMVNRELPFRYPAELYARRVQGNVTLRLFVDTDGRARPESTRIEEPSGYAALDTAALRGAQELQFVPAKLHGDPRAVSVLFPVYFRHPEASPLPGDTILNQPARTARP
jgi:TonB family protein